jgi:F0F1-type ATP synthase membrane subunit c/vacuolar-type H+-ATPase subunit K
MNHRRITQLIALPATVLVLAGGSAAAPIAIAAAAPIAKAATARSAADQVRTACFALRSTAIHAPRARFWPPTCSRST